MDRFWLWIDGVGGYLVCGGERVVLGRPNAMDETTTEADVTIQADLGRHHASITREGESYRLEASRATYVDDGPVDKALLLRDGQVVRLGEDVRLRFSRPSRLSNSARLDAEGAVAFRPTVSGVILMGETLILGPDIDHHVVCRDWLQRVVLVRRKQRLEIHGPDDLTIDGRPIRDGILPRSGNVRVTGEHLAFTLQHEDVSPIPRIFDVP